MKEVRVDWAPGRLIPVSPLGLSCAAVLTSFLESGMHHMTVWNIA